jgi:tricarballylate dehydrogenase
VSVTDTDTDVVVVGAGNAALSAAVMAVERGADVVVVEKSPRSMRGGNTQFTALYRFAYADLDALRALATGIDDELAAKMDVPAYTEEQYFHDLMRMSGWRANPDLMRILANESYESMVWLKSQGLQWQPSLGGAKTVNGMYTWQPGIVIHPVLGGVGLLNTLFGFLEKRGIKIMYDAPVVALLTSDDGAIRGVRLRTGRGSSVETTEIRAAAVILGAGGFEANMEKRAMYLGPGWDLVKVRGSRYNTGEVLEMAMNAGAATTGQWSGCHATMVHSEAGAFEMGDGAFPHAYPLSLVLNLDGERFADEGENFQFYTYAKLGRAVLAQRDGKAFQLFDAKTSKLWAADWAEDHAYVKLPHPTGNTLREVAELAKLENVDRFVKTVEQFNAAVQEGTFDPSRLDGKRTRGLQIDKTNWALRVDSPPYHLVPVECGITFTFGGIAFNEHGQALDVRGEPIPGLYVVGEMAGCFFQNYAGGSGLAKGTVFGRRAGAHAAARATKPER